MYPRRPANPPGYKPKPKPRKPDQVFQPLVYQNLKAGVDLLANALRPTLGPLPRLVAIQKIIKEEPPEILDNGAVIARRIIQVKGRKLDPGAMLLRHFAWQMQRTVGDGSVTMAVIFQSLIDEGIRYIIMEGGNSMLLRKGLENALKIVRKALQEQAVSIENNDEIGEIARGLCQGDDELAKMLGEIMDIIGKDGTVEIQPGSRTGLEREYIEGTYWDSSGWFSSIFQTDIEKHRSLVENAQILISDFYFKNADELIPFMELAAKAKIQNLIIISAKMPDDAIGLFIKNSKSNTINVLPVQTPHIAEDDRIISLGEIAILTGGRAFHSHGGESINDVKLEHLGSARLAWANDKYFGVIGGKGDSKLVRKYVNELKNSIKKNDSEQREEVQKRIGRLIGGSAVLKVGGRTESEIEIRKIMAERAVLALRNVLDSGVVLGGGTSLMRCQAVLGNDGSFVNEEDIAARRIFARALEAPLRAIVTNAGLVPDTIVDKVKAAQEGYGFDARSFKIVDMKKAGIVDALKVVDMALQVAVSGAIMALTTDVIVHRKLPPEIAEP